MGRFLPDSWWAGSRLYFQQPQERRERIKSGAGKVGMFLLEQAGEAAAEVSQARIQLTTNAVPKPKSRNISAAVIRELALSAESLSAQQLADLLDESERPSVASLRAYLRANDKTLVYEVRRGGFVLGQHYRPT